MRAALEHLRERAAGRRTVAVLGEMAELGDYAEEGHREVGARSRRPGSTSSSPSARRPRPTAGAGSRAPTRRRGSCATSSSPATACSSRAPARSPSKASPTTWRTCPRNGPSPHRGHRRPGDLDRARPEADRVPAPQRVRPADPRGGAAARGEAGDAGDGRAADHGLDGRRVPAPLGVHDRRRDRPLLHGRLRGDRLLGRPHQGAPPPLARPARPLEAARPAR